MSNNRMPAANSTFEESSSLSDSTSPTEEQTDETPKTAIPVPCQDDIFKNGHTVFVIHHQLKSEYIEVWVKEVAKRSGEKVDWHYSGGHANILGMGDFEKIRNTIKEMLPELNKLINAYNILKYGHFFQPVNYKPESLDQWNNREVFRSCFRPE